jgi:hypothetical protein
MSSVRGLVDVKSKINNVAAVALVALLFASGCGGAYDSSVAGVVKLDGKTLPRGLVGFHPVSAGPSAYAVIDESGGYAVRTGRESGLPPGEYCVTVSANELPATERTETGNPPPPGKSITPAWYRTKQASGLKFTVKPGKNEINLELTSKPPAGSNSQGQKKT